MIKKELVKTNSFFIEGLTKKKNTAILKGEQEVIKRKEPLWKESLI